MTAEQIAANIRYTFFTASNDFAKMPAHIQRELFGSALFGRKLVRWDAANSRVKTRIIVDYGRDYHDQYYTLERVAEMVNSGELANGSNGSKPANLRQW